MVYYTIRYGDLRSTMVEKVVAFERMLLFGRILEIFKGFSLHFSSVEDSPFDLFWSFGLTD